MTSSFGQVPKDAAFTNLNVAESLVASEITVDTLVANNEIVNDLSANKISVDVLSIRGEELTASAKQIDDLVNSGGGGGGGGSVVPGTVTQILTSNGSGQILAPGSSLTDTGTLNLTSVNATLPKIEFKSATVLANDPVNKSLCIGTNAQGITAAQNTIIGENAGLALTTGDSNIAIGANCKISTTSKSNVCIGSPALIDVAADENVVIGQNAKVSNIGVGSVSIGCNAQANGTGIGPAFDVKSVSIGHFARTNNRYSVAVGANSLIQTTGSAEGSIAIGASAVVNTSKDLGSLVIGYDSSANGSRNDGLPSVVIGSFSIDGTVNGNGSTILGNNNFTNQPDCICLGNGAATPTQPGQLAIPGAIASVGGSIGTLAGYIRLKIKGEGAEFRIPFYNA